MKIQDGGHEWYFLANLLSLLNFINISVGKVKYSYSDRRQYKKSKVLAFSNLKRQIIMKVHFVITYMTGILRIQDGEQLKKPEL